VKDLSLQILDAARVFLSLSFFIYASWSDWKKREVSNKVWVVLAPLAFALTAIEYVFFLPELLFYFALSFSITSILSIVLFYAGAFGGADAKALICLALALPNYPIHILPTTSFLSPIFPLTVFSNGVLLAAFSVFYAAIRNYAWKLRTGAKLFAGFENESIWRKILVLLTGYKIDSAILEKNAYVYPLEDIVITETGENERRLLSFPKDESREAIVARILSAWREGKLQNGVWVTPGLPLLIFITAGLVIALLFGDIIWMLLQFILIPH
jgi:preflagellin peptidase FlaK